MYITDIINVVKHKSSVPGGSMELLFELFLIEKLHVTVLDAWPNNIIFTLAMIFTNVLSNNKSLIINIKVEDYQ